MKPEGGPTCPRSFARPTIAPFCRNSRINLDTLHRNVFHVTSSLRIPHIPHTKHIIYDLYDLVELLRAIGISVNEA